jgi:hypothetical protein
MEICDIKPSPVVGAIKSEIEEAILDGVIPNEYDPAKEYFMEHKYQWLAEYKEKYKKKL